MAMLDGPGDLCHESGQRGAAGMRPGRFWLRKEESMRGMGIAGGLVVAVLLLAGVVWFYVKPGGLTFGPWQGKAPAAQGHEEQGTQSPGDLSLLPAVNRMSKDEGPGPGSSEAGPAAAAPVTPSPAGGAKGAERRDMGVVPAVLLAEILSSTGGGEAVKARLQRFRARLASVEDPGEMQRLWKQIQAAKAQSAPSGYEARNVVLERWAQMAGMDAMNALLSLKEGEDIYAHESFSKVMNAWASVDSLAALEWYHAPEQDALSLERGFKPSSEFYEKAFGDYFVKDPARALQSVTALNRFSDAGAAVQGMVGRASNPGEWLTIAKGLEVTEGLDTREALLVEAYTQANLPQEAATWVEAVPDQAMRTELAKKVANVWGRQEPFQAADWLYERVREQPDAWAIVDAMLSRQSPTAMQEWAAKKGIKK